MKAMRRSVDQTEQIHVLKEKRAQDENVALLQCVCCQLQGERHADHPTGR
jgi:hypothetical protein